MCRNLLIDFIVQFDYNVHNVCDHLCLFKCLFYERIKLDLYELNLFVHNSCRFY